MPFSPVALVVSADRHLRRLVAASLDQIGCASVDVATSREGLECVGATRIDFVIVDVCLTDAFEEVLIRQLRVDRPDLKALYLIGRANPVFNRGSIIRRIDAYLRKPFRLYELHDVVTFLLHDHDGFAPVKLAGTSLN